MRGAGAGSGGFAVRLSRWIGGLRAKHHALAQHQRPIAHSELQSGDNAADRSEHRRQIGDGRRQDVAEPADPAGLQLRLSRQRRRLPRSAGDLDRWRRQRAVGQENRHRLRPRRLADRGAQCAQRRQRNRGRDRRRADRCAGRRTGAAPQACAPAVAEFSAGRRHHRPVPHHRPPLDRDRQPRTRCRFRFSFGAAELPLSAAGPEDGSDRGRSRAICARQTSVARGPYAGARRQRHRRRDRFRHRRQASRTRRCDCRQLRCARQQGRSACPRHRRRRRDRGACAADGERAGGADSGDPRVRHLGQGRGKHDLRGAEGARLRGRRMARGSSI